MNKIFFLILISFSLSTHAKDPCTIKYVKKHDVGATHSQKIIDLLKKYYIRAFSDEVDVTIQDNDITVEAKFWTYWAAGANGFLDVKNAEGHYLPSVRVNNLLFKGEETYLIHSIGWARHYDELGNFVNKECIMRTRFWADALYNTKTGVMVIGPKRLEAVTKINLPID